MAGHSKWANIQHRKGAQDKKRAKIFTKLGREIIVAARLGGGDPDMNPRLRLAIQKAKGANMPNDRIKAAIDKGTGDAGGEDYEEIRYEGYGPGGVAVIVEALSDNRNRTAGEVRSCFSKNNGNMGETGCVGFMFDRVGEIFYPPETGSSEMIFEAAVEAGAENVESDDQGHQIITRADDLASVRDHLEETFGEAQRTGLIWQPNILSDVTSEQVVELMKLVDALEDNDDVQSVTTNVNLSDEDMERLLASG
jgi:YebC/PmpR family DNA-binding regulatory protein